MAVQTSQKKSRSTVKKKTSPKTPGSSGAPIGIKETPILEESMTQTLSQMPKQTHDTEPRGKTSAADLGVKKIGAADTGGRGQTQASPRDKADPITKTPAAGTGASFFEIGLLFLGLFCVMAGFGLIIASNWAVIPGVVKIIGGLALLGNGLFGVYWMHEKQKPLLMEAALFFSFLMIGANIALVQQVYHLAVSFSNGALLWALLAVPLLFITKKQVLPICWLALFLFGFYDYLLDVFDIIGYKGVAGFFFLTYILSFLGEKGFAKLVRGASIILMIIVTFLGDMGLFSDSFSPLGMLLTIILMGLLSQANAENKPVRFFNLVLVYVAARVVMLFWAAYASLFQTGLVLIAFGALLLGIGALYYFKREALKDLFEKGFNR